MEEKIIKKYSVLESLNVSREIYSDFESLALLLKKKNDEINIISKENADIDIIRSRHIIDSAQIIDFVNLNSNTTYDLGSGGGMPGLVIAIMIKKLKKDMRIILYEKSYHKSLFLKEASRKLNLNTEVVQHNIFEDKNLESGTIMSRAFKPLPIILDLVNKNFDSYKNLILFMGKNGRQTLETALKDWDLDYVEKRSLTSQNSFILNIKKIKKKFLN
tara:strand:- start:34 stop:684 length:651 start_codon:yes stop_codon:yes gene_type:complete